VADKLGTAWLELRPFLRSAMIYREFDANMPESRFCGRI
jgi:hypothetical protein